MNNDATADIPRWITGRALAALAQRGLREGDRFTSRDLMAWVPELSGRPNAWSVSKPLVAMGFVTASVACSETEPGQTHGTYTLTRAGAQAIAAAAAGARFASGPRGPHGKNRSVPRAAFVSRLWALLRARQMLDTDSAAALLVDAGDDAAVRRAAATAKRYFHRWAQLGVVQESARRLPNGCKRWVLIKDVGPTPPAWTPKARARRDQTTAQGAA